MKAKNLLLLPSVWLPAALTFLVQSNTLLNAYVDGVPIQKSKFIDLFFAVPTYIVSGAIRYLEDDNNTVYTPGILPGANRSDCEAHINGIVAQVSAQPTQVLDELPESQIWENNYSLDTTVNEEYFDNKA